MADRDKLLRAIDDGRSRSYGGDENSELGQRRARLLEAYFGLNTIPAPEGRSNVVDRSVYETIHTILPSLVRIFAGSSDEVCKFLPVGPEDEQAAEQTTQVINHVVTQLNNWEQICADWIHDALLLPNAYCMAYWDESSRVERHTYEDQSDDQVAMIVSDASVKVIQHSAEVDEEATRQQMAMWQQASQMAIAQGMMPPPEPGQVMKHDLVIERINDEGKVCIKVLPPEHCEVSFDTPDWTLTACPYFEYGCNKTIADLRAMGLDVPDDISDDADSDTEEDQIRDRFGEDSDGGGEEEGAMRRVWTRMIWVDADAEDDGMARKYYVLAVGRTILYEEAVGRVMVSSMVSQPLPHRHPGMPIAETVLDIQDIRTSVTRGGLDNLNLSNAGRHVISSAVSLADFLDARPGGAVRMLNDELPGQGHIVPLVHPVVFDQVIGSLEYFDQVRQNRTGASRYFSGTDANAINKTASGTIALQSMASMRVEHIARMMAPAVEQLFSIVHELISKHQSKPLTLQLRNKWVQVDPQAWMKKRDVRLSVGVGAGNKDQMMAQLQGVLAAQMQVGMPLGLVQRENIHATNVEILKLAGFANPQKFWPDPSQLPPPQPPANPDQIKAQARMQELQFQAGQDAQKNQADQQMEMHRMQMQAELDRNREEMQARQKAIEAEMQAAIQREQIASQERIAAVKAELEKYKADLQAAVTIQSAQTSSTTAERDSGLAQQLSGSIEQLMLALQTLQQERDMPVELVRNPQTGRAEGIKRGERVRKIARGPDGRAMGIQ